MAEEPRDDVQMTVSPDTAVSGRVTRSQSGTVSVPLEGETGHAQTGRATTGVAPSAAPATGGSTDTADTISGGVAQPATSANIGSASAEKLEELAVQVYGLAYSQCTQSQRDDLMFFDGIKPNRHGQPSSFDGGQRSQEENAARNKVLATMKPKVGESTSPTGLSVLPISADS
jgi:hypothetical protein